MKLPKGYLPRKGDKFVLIAELKHNVEAGEDFAFLTIKSRHGAGVDVTVNVDKLELHRIGWRPLDWARSIEFYGVCGQVVAVHEGNVWLKDTSGMMRSFADDAIEPIEDPTAKTATEPMPVEAAVAAAMEEPPPAPLELSPDDKDDIIEGGFF